ncbi:MAG: hypothetical protein ACO21B_03775, partial [Gemmobacter sp.]
RRRRSTPRASVRRRCSGSRPADAAGLRDRGRLIPGLRADVIRIAEDGPLPRLRGVWSAGVRVG